MACTVPHSLEILLSMIMSVYGAKEMPRASTLENAGTYSTSGMSKLKNDQNLSERKFPEARSNNFGFMHFADGVCGPTG